MLTDGWGRCEQALCASGLELATRLGHKLGKKKRAQIILIDRNRQHIWKPLLHEIATGSLDINSDGVIYRAHAAAHHYQFQLGAMIGLDNAGKVIRLQSLHDDDDGKEVLPEREITYDTLVMAVGSVSNDFGTPGVAEHSYFLDSHHQAECFHMALLNQFLRINQKSTEAELRLAIVGGEAAGVELAAELNHVADLLKVYGMPDMSAKRLKIDLIEAGPRILPALPQRIAAAAKKELSILGITIHENVRVTSADENSFITLDGDPIKADLKVWAAGLKLQIL